MGANNKSKKYVLKVFIVQFNFTLKFKIIKLSKYSLYFHYLLLLFAKQFIS